MVHTVQLEKQTQFWSQRVLEMFDRVDHTAHWGILDMIVNE